MIMVEQLFMVVILKNQVMKFHLHRMLNSMKILNLYIQYEVMKISKFIKSLNFITHIHKMEQHWNRMNQKKIDLVSQNQGQ